MATAPRPGAMQRKQLAEAAVSFVIDGDTYTFRPVELTARVTRECREVTGLSPMGILGQLNGPNFTADLDVLAAFMWVCKRQSGEEVDFDELLDRVNLEWLATAEMTEDHSEPEEGSPEA